MDNKEIEIARGLNNWADSFNYIYISRPDELKKLRLYIDEFNLEVDLWNASHGEELQVKKLIRL